MKLNVAEMLVIMLILVIGGLLIVPILSLTHKHAGPTTTPHMVATPGKP